MKYNILLIDPPWSYQDKGCSGSIAKCSKVYSTMSIKDLCTLPINKIADDNSILFLWATYPLMKEAMQLIEAWGFDYKSIAFQWIKLNKKNGKPFYGLGRWTRGNTEPLLLATKGKPQRVSKGVFQLIQSPIRGHSSKPPEAREQILKLMGDLPRIEIFARERVEGWAALGFDLDGKDIRDSLKETIDK